MDTVNEQFSVRVPEIKPCIVRVKMPVLNTPDQSYSLEEVEKITAYGFPTETSLQVIKLSCPGGEVLKAGTLNLVVPINVVKSYDQLTHTEGIIVAGVTVKLNLSILGDENGRVP